MAKESEVAVIAMTDHDTIGGVAEALAAGDTQGVRVIAGIEMSVEDHGAHILGFGIDHTNTALLARLDEFQKARVEGAKQMAKNLADAGFALAWEDVAREARGAMARPHIARAILARAENKEKLGGITTSHDFIQEYLTDKSPYYVRRAHISAKDAISLIHSSGGVAVWSHPVLHFHGDPDGLETFLKELIGWSMEGVEVFSPAHTEDGAEYLYALAEKYVLLRTGGSDFHEKGEHAPDARGLHSARSIGDFETHGFPTDDIVQKLDEAVAKRKAAADA